MRTKYKVNGELFDSEQEAQEYCHEQEIIYYYKAVEYLAENDASFVKSLDLACDMGYDINSLNSELLATLLHQQELLNSIEEVE